MRARLTLLGVALGLGPASAQADGLWELPVGTSPHSLHMRASAWQMAASADEEGDAPEDPAAQEKPDSIFSLPTGRGLNTQSGGVDRLERRQLEADVQAPPDPLSEKLIFRFNLGMGLDSGLASNDPMLSGGRLADVENYRPTRIYGFADTVAGTKGLGITGLNSYFAAHFRYNEDFSNSSSALPSVYDQNLQRPLVRSAYAEAEDIFESKLLKPLYIRGGRSYHYGLAVVQYDGVEVGYDTPGLKLSFFGGPRTGLYGLEKDVLATEKSISGSNIRVDFFEWKRWPLVAFASHLEFDDHTHTRSGVALRWNRDILLSSSARTIDGKLARSDFRLRARISKVTTVNVQLNNRFRSDWSYGLLLIATPEDSTDPRKYLDFGTVLPRSLLNVRYGTVLFRNLDLLVRGGAAIDRRDRKNSAPSSFSSSYAELGGAAEVRVRRNLRVGTALSSRRYFISNDKAESVIAGRPDTLPSDLGSTGTTSYWEGGLNMYYSPGARQFSAQGELYGRRYSLRSEFLKDTVADLRTGGRFAVEGWVRDRVRLKAEYDLTFGRLIMAPELRTLRTLRVLMEGSF